MFDGDKIKYKLWETEILGYLKLKGFKEIVHNLPRPDAAEKNENANSWMIVPWDW